MTEPTTEHPDLGMFSATQRRRVAALQLASVLAPGEVLATAQWLISEAPGLLGASNDMDPLGWCLNCGLTRPECDASRIKCCPDCTHN